MISFFSKYRATRSRQQWLMVCMFSDESLWDTHLRYARLKENSASSAWHPRKSWGMIWGHESWRQCREGPLKVAESLLPILEMLVHLAQSSVFYYLKRERVKWSCVCPVRLCVYHPFACEWANPLEDIIALEHGPLIFLNYESFPKPVVRSLAVNYISQLLSRSWETFLNKMLATQI